ncbi:MAG TPA: hypothetical protein EYQ21_02395 [Flavobacteriales bacterium]|nr:hypothetical protein [Flavobacteriales bacterium]
MKEVEPEIQQAMDNIAARKKLIKQKQKSGGVEEQLHHGPRAPSSISWVSSSTSPDSREFSDDDEYTHDTDAETQLWVKSTELYENYQAIKKQDSWD